LFPPPFFFFLPLLWRERIKEEKVVRIPFLKEGGMEEIGEGGYSSLF